MKTKIIQNIKSVIVIALLVVGVSYVSAWTSAPANPPSNNVDAPINVGGSAQIKAGPLTLGGLGILGDLKFLPVSGTPPTTGQVLVADDSDLAHGKVKWGTGTSSSDTVYNSGWQPATSGAMTFPNPLGSTDLLVQIFTSQVAAGTNPVIASNYNSYQRFFGPASGGITITSITNSSISLNVGSKKNTVEPTQHLSNSLVLDTFDYIRVLAKKAPAGIILGQRNVYSDLSGSNWIDVRSGTLINGDCPTNTYKQYVGTITTSNLTNNSLDLDNDFICTETIISN